MPGSSTATPTTTWGDLRRLRRARPKASKSMPSTASPGSNICWEWCSWNAKTIPAQPSTCRAFSVQSPIRGKWPRPKSNWRKSAGSPRWPQLPCLGRKSRAGSQRTPLRAALWEGHEFTRAVSSQILTYAPMGRNCHQKGYKEQRRRPQTLKRSIILNDLAARVELVPFPTRARVLPQPPKAGPLWFHLWGRARVHSCRFVADIDLRAHGAQLPPERLQKTETTSSDAKALNHSERLGGTSGTRALPNPPEFFRNPLKPGLFGFHLWGRARGKGTSFTRAVSSPILTYAPIGRNCRERLQKTETTPSGAKALSILNDLVARVKLVPFPIRQSSSATRKSRASLVSPLGKGTSSLVPFRGRY